MTDKKLEHFQEKLLAEKRRLMEQVNVKFQQSLELDEEMKADPVDLSVMDSTRSTLLAVSTQDSQTLQMIDAALQRIEEGEYGICQNCGEEIAEKRLEAVPWARLDIKCQEAVERGMDVETPSL